MRRCTTTFISRASQLWAARPVNAAAARIQPTTEVVSRTNRTGRRMDLRPPAKLAQVPRDRLRPVRVGATRVRTRLGRRPERNEDPEEGGADAHGRQETCRRGKVGTEVAAAGQRRAFVPCGGARVVLAEDAEAALTHPSRPAVMLARL